MCIILQIIFLANFSQVYAQQSRELPNIVIQPGMFIYPLMRLEEKFLEKFQFNSGAKEKYYQDLVQKRLAELKFVIDNNYLDEVEKSSQRVSYQVGILTDYIVREKLDSNKSTVIDLYNKDKLILEKLRDKYHSNSSFWLLVQHIINSLDINLQKL